MNKSLFLSIIFIITNLFSVQVCLANETATNQISGVVYVDANGNGQMDAAEEAVAHASINFQEMGSDVIQGLITDISGSFSMDQIPSGKYMVWSENRGVKSDMVMVKIDETNSNVIIGLAMSAMSAAMDMTDLEMTEVQLQTILLPFIVN